MDRGTRLASLALLVGLVAVGFTSQWFHFAKQQAKLCCTLAEAASRPPVARTASAAPRAPAVPGRIPAAPRAAVDGAVHAEVSTRPQPARPPFLWTRDVPEKQIEQSLAQHGVRLLPYPFQHVFNFTSDADGCTPDRFERYHEVLNHRCGLDVGDSVFLLSARPTAVRFFDPASLQFHGRALVPYYHRGWLDVLHGFSEACPVIADLLPPGSVLRPQAPLALRGDIPSASNTYENTKRTAKDVQPLAALVLAFEARDVQADVVLAGPDGRKHYIAVNRPLGSRPGWQVESPDTTIDIVLGIQQEENVSARDRLTALSGISTVSLEHANCPQAAVQRLVATTMTREIIVSSLETLRQQYNMLFTTVTDHSCSYFFGEDKKLVHQPYTLADAPGSYVYVTDYMLHRQGLEFVNPAVWTSEAVELGVTALVVPTWLRDGQAVYCARRRFYSELYHLGLKNASAANAVPDIIELFLKRAVGPRHATYVCYTHLGGLDPPISDPYGKPFVAEADKLCDRVYNLSGRVPPDQRVWVARTSSLYRYAQVLRQVAGNVEVDGSRVMICRWCDEVSGRPLPGPVPLRDLHGLTVYVEDAQHARAWLDGEELTSFTRNAADATGRESITFVDDSQPRVLFDEVDFCYRHTNMSRDAIGWDKDVVHLDPTLEYYLRQGHAPRGLRYGELLLKESGTATMTVDTPTFDARDTFYLRLKYKKSSAASRFSFALQTADGRWHAVAEDGLRQADEAGWTVPAQAAGAWHDRVVAFADEQPASRGGRRTLLQQKVTALRFRVEGKADDRFFFDQIELLRPCALPEEPLQRKILAGRVDPPLPGVDVRIAYTKGLQCVSATTTTDAQGYFGFSQIPRGSTVEVTATREGHVFLPDQGRWLEMYADQAEVRIGIEAAAVAFDASKRKRKGETVARDFGTVYKPHSEVVSVGMLTAPQSTQVTHQMNNWGFFDRDRRIANPDHNVRILMAGTCLLEGQQVNLGERVNLQLEQILSQRTGRYCEVPNFSFSFLSTSAFLPYYEALGRKLAPRVVIMSVSQGSELLFNYWELEQKRGGYDDEHPPGHVFVPGKDGQLLSRRGDPNFAAFMSSPAKLPGDDNYYIYQKINWLKALCRKDRQYPPLVQDALRRYVAILKHYRQILNRDQVKLAFVLTTEIELCNFSPEWREDNVEYGTKYYADNMRAIFAQADVPLVVLSDYFKKQANPSSAHWEHDTHFSRVGHRWCAEALADFLIERGSVPGLRHTGILLPREDAPRPAAWQRSPGRVPTVVLR